MDLSLRNLFLVLAVLAVGAVAVLSVGVAFAAVTDSALATAATRSMDPMWWLVAIDPQWSFAVHP